MSVLRPIPLPDGQTDAFCAVCKREVVLPIGTLRCPYGEHEVHPASLAVVPKSARPAEPSPASAVEQAAQSADPIYLPPIREAVAWDRATDALLEAVEREEADALAAFEAARDRVKSARRVGRAMRQLRALVSVDQAAPARAASSGTGRRWSRQHEACIECGTTQVVHASAGRCKRCYDRQRHRRR